MKPIGRQATSRRRNQRVSNTRPFQRSQRWIRATVSISMPIPIMIRNVQNTIVTGGRSSGANCFRPGTAPSSEWVRIRLPR